MNIPGLRSPSDQVGGLNHFGRMLDKIRLHAAGTLPADFVPNLGKGFDERCVDFLHVSYAPLVERVNEGGSDEEILDWCHEQGRKPSEEELEIWNEFMRKRGWNDGVTPILRRRMTEGGFEARSDVQTMFGYIDLDEGREPRIDYTPTN